MSDPQLALWLYVAIVVMQLMFSKRWAAFYSTVASAGAAKVGVTAGSTQGPAGAGQHGL
jgi:hypothetical protein